MNNDIPRFDPMTGQPLTNQTSNIQQPVNQTNIPIIQENSQPNQTIELMQNVATVEQNQQEFINKVQNSNTNEEKKEEKTNYGFIIFLFILILAAIFFLFPYLIKIL